ncbi:MAG: transcription termination factor NusA [Planctomycetota bacterium]
MNGEELLRVIDAIHRDKDIDKEILFESIEMALATAARKRYGTVDDLTVRIDRSTGDIHAFVGSEAAAFVDLGRIAAQTAKQVIIQRIRDAEQDVILRDYEHKVGDLVTGTVQRIEGGNIIVNLGKAEGIVPRSEKVRGENYHPGDRIKALVTEVRKVGPKVRIVLSRGHPDLVAQLFELEVPEIADRVIEIKRIAREPGYRTKIAVSSYDNRVDCIGACVGIRGTRIKSITDELNGEKIDIIRWNDSIEVLIMNALRPAQIASIQLDETKQEAVVTVPDDQLSLGIGRKGQNVRLASKLTGWEIKIQSTSQADGVDRGAAAESSEEAAMRAVAAALGAELPSVREGSSVREAPPAALTPGGDVSPGGASTSSDSPAPSDAGRGLEDHAAATSAPGASEPAPTDHAEQDAPPAESAGSGVPATSGLAECPEAGQDAPSNRSKIENAAGQESEQPSVGAASPESGPREEGREDGAASQES